MEPFPVRRTLILLMICGCLLRPDFTGRGPYLSRVNWKLSQRRQRCRAGEHHEQRLHSKWYVLGLASVSLHRDSKQWSGVNKEATRGSQEKTLRSRSPCASWAPPLHRGLVRGSFPAPHHHDLNKMLLNFCIWVMVVVCEEG